MKSKILFAALLAVFLGIANMSSAQDGNFAKTPANNSTENRHHHHHHHHHKTGHGGMGRRQAYYMHRYSHRQGRFMAYRRNGRLNRHDQYRWNHRENRSNHGIVRI
jgi:Ni/Co efflux regulator RcnB